MMKNRPIHVAHKDNLEWTNKNSVEGKPLRFGYLVNDEDTGMFVRYYTYYAGTVTPPHTHHCSHGMYVISGTLHTNAGDYGPGSFVWFPEGTVGVHGATEDADLECIFITNKPFDITYEDPELEKINKAMSAPKK